MRRMNLTPAIKIAYAYPIAALPAVGFSSSELTKGAQAPSNPSVLFLFAPEGLLYGGMRGETFGSAGLAFCVRSANPAYAVTNLFSSEWCRLGSELAKGTTLMSTLFVLREGISDKECREQIRIYAFQAHALTQLINDAVDNCHVGDVSPDIKDHLGWAFWALSDVLRAQIVLCERVYERKPDSLHVTKESPHV